MDGDVKLLLVSSGASSEALVEELERLKVVVEPCAFAEAEEQLETNPPDLVALVGARGAIELANMIDDLEDAPKMVIVAERKELAKLRGLNREVVVSLFAMETTEKVVGQRIESLARRAHRRREQATGVGSAGGAKRTALGLPTGEAAAAAAAVARVNLKKPPGERAPAADGDEPQSSGKHPGAEPETPSPAPAAQPQTAGEPQEVSDEELLESMRPPAVGAPDAHSSGASGFGAGALVTENLPMTSLGPDADEEPPPVSVPPTLPPQAKSQGATPQAPIAAAAKTDEAKAEPAELNDAAPDQPKPPGREPTGNEGADKKPGVKKDLSLKIDPGDLDLTAAESALENLDSVKMDLNEDIIQHAKKGLEPESGDHAKLGASAEEPEELDVDALESLRPEEDDEAAGVNPGLEMTMPLGAMDPPPDLKEAVQDAPTSATGAPEGSHEPQPEEPPPQQPAPTSPVIDPSSAQTLVSEAPPSIPGASKNGGGSGKALGLLVALVIGVGGIFFVYKMGIGDGGETKASTAHKSAEKEALEGGAAVEQEPADNGSAAEPKKAGDAAEAEADKTDPSEDPEVAPAEERLAAADDAPEASASASSTDLTNPFKMKDSGKPSCDSLLSNNAPEAGGDPIAQSSDIWAEARQAIVRGKMDEANLLMCQAVALNPESAAVEGLAHHYLAVGAYSEALKWVDKADELRPGQLDMGYLRGDIFGMMGEIEKAREIWLTTLSIEPEEEQRIRGVSKDNSVEGGRHLRRGDYTRAEIFFRRAVILDQDNLNGIIGLAKTYHRLEKFDYTQAFCEMSLKVSDVIPEVHVLLGDMAQARGEKDEARQRYERALAVRPGFFPAKRGLAEVQ